MLESFEQGHCRDSIILPTFLGVYKAYCHLVKFALSASSRKKNKSAKNVLSKGRFSTSGVTPALVKLLTFELFFLVLYFLCER